MDWTAEAIDRLRTLWAEGHSTAEIGRRMGVTKNAVVGKAHRLALPARPSPIRRQAPTAARPAAAFRRPVEPAVAGQIGAGQTGAGQTGTGQTPGCPQPPQVGPRRPEPAAARPARSPGLEAPCAAVPPAAVRPAPASAVTSLPLLLMRPFPRTTLRNCCWPMGEPGSAEFRFCSGEAITGKPYCPEHAAVAYVKARDRREDAA